MVNLAVSFWVEPGVYFPFHSQIPTHFQGIGIRIEDDVLVQPEYPIVFTATTPKEIIDIEALQS